MYNNISNIFTNSDTSTDTDDASNNSENNTTVDEIILKKYSSPLQLNNKTFYEEMNELELNLDQDTSVLRELEINTIKNNLPNIKNLLDKGHTLYKPNKICSNPICTINQKCNKNCYKNALYYAITTNTRCIKTIFNLLIRLITIQPEFRNKCKCCITTETKKDITKLEHDPTDGSINIELQISHTINKFISSIAMLPCQCKYINKHIEFYPDNFMNFRKTVHIYKNTIPHLLNLLKKFYNITENHEDLTLIKESRCIHEDIKFTNIVYCIHKQYHLSPDLKKLQEIICNVELIDKCISQNTNITITLLNQQSLEMFKLIPHKYKNTNADTFYKIYGKHNNLLNLNYTSNKQNLLQSILSTNHDITLMIQTFIQQLIIRTNPIEINIYLIQYIIQCFTCNHYPTGLEFLKHLKPLELEPHLIKYIFDTILENNLINIQLKISYIKLINKNKINIIQYDFINKLIDLDTGDNVIQEFAKEDTINNLLTLEIYNNHNHINSTIKKCITHKKPHILNYILHHLNNTIKTINKTRNLINPYIHYFSHVLTHKTEYEYTNLLTTITNYTYDMNEHIEITDNNKITKHNLLILCIKRKLTASAKILITNGINTNVTHENKNLIYHCIDNKNHIIFHEILLQNPKLSNEQHNNTTIATYLLTQTQIIDEDVLMRFLMKLFTITEYNINYSDNNNLHIGFQILDSTITQTNKIILFKLITPTLNPLTINKRIPLILYSLTYDEYDITYLLLDKLVINKNIKKYESQSQAQNQNQNQNPFLEYDHDSSNININFIPIIFKYIKENKIKHINNTVTELESDIRATDTILIIIELTIYILFDNSQIIPTEQLYIENNVTEEDNKYTEIDDTKYASKKLWLDDEYQYDKNIWKNINTHSEPENNNTQSSEIEETDICFTNEL
ncbi:MAG: hypothetical protein Gaeavirus10_3 [Gaeavirus sp.]|uniref:Ankyrin repeat protein n=1 Tax=Gaeavirus sp. TaxID=2487767 RepID=A0A3G4ZYX0_9VIRU|nr:MAG: hypothetical protein Gaeavirus10_3 [Gaeavirus sp.]